ncbi:accessory Sec system protein Asp1 [Pseudobutyrivibrio sp.]|uniref:accessory Sec system protein Asp1 n=1 Tax=Pseudobutyrivibrio sp. TaxID=2014367 RepID=UPI001D6648E0|nr:accessory Sec system protein Asp1 [Pseudobutyrivibrio sp.]MBE5912342.1 accessory Sec system protein Asp1 [Pseudobutyrivibrio sp.]
MLYFIPAWYQQNKWRESEQSWHMRRMHTEFDDTVKQVQMFYRNGMRDFKILLLSHTPNFRHFLHRQGVFHAPYWSCFDSIQEVERKKAEVFSFHNLNWPDEIEFVYTPFVVVAYLHYEKYAEINFGEAGNPIEVSMYTQGVVSRKNIYDDRGFVSSTEVYENGNIVYTDYLKENGITKFREYASNGRVEINANSNTYFVMNADEKSRREFKKLQYDSISEVIAEVMEAHLEESDDNDIFCIAMHELNALVMKDYIEKKKCILSFYGERYRIKEHPEGRELVKKSGYIITDSEATSRYLKRDMEVELDKIIDISPYDSRMDFGISQQLTVQNILVPVDNLPEVRFKLLMVELAKYVTTNENARVHIFTRNATYGLPDRLLNNIADIVEEAGYDRGMVIPDEAEDTTAENEFVDADEQQTVKFTVDQCVDELSVSKCIREQRIMVDMRHNPDLYLQINCISSAIPQLVRRETQYILNGGNGFVIKDFGRIPAALDYFLGTLSNWNQAKVHSYEIGQKFTTKKLLEKWKNVMTSLEN